jgi:hypothetical protein
VCLVFVVGISVHRKPFLQTIFWEKIWKGISELLEMLVESDDVYCFWKKN